MTFKIYYLIKISRLYKQEDNELEIPRQRISYRKT